MVKKADDATDGNRWIAVVVTILGAMLGGSGGTYLYLGSGFGPEQIQAIARPDPFTGTQGLSLENRLSLVERRVDQLPPRELQVAVEVMRSELERLKERIDHLETEMDNNH